MVGGEWWEVGRAEEGLGLVERVRGQGVGMDQRFSSQYCI